MVGGTPTSAPLTPDTLPLVGRPASGVAAPRAVDEKTKTHKDKLATDPRFAGWLGLMSAGDHTPSAADIARQQERDELLRRAYLAAIQRAEAGQDVPADYLATARAFVAATQPLQRPIGAGDPSQ